MGELSFFDVMRLVILCSTPLVFFVGILLVLYGNYTSFEATRAKELGIRKRIMPKLEKNVYAFHEWCLKKNILIGVICIIYAVIIFLVLGKLSFPSDVVN